MDVVSHNTPGHAAACLAVLREGPATTGEVAAAVGLPSKLAGTHLANQAKLGKCSHAPFGDERDSRGRPRKLLWSIAEAP